MFGCEVGVGGVGGIPRLYYHQFCSVMLHLGTHVYYVCTFRQWLYSLSPHEISLTIVHNRFRRLGPLCIHMYIEIFKVLLGIYHQFLLLVSTVSILLQFFDSKDSFLNILWIKIPVVGELSVPFMNFANRLGQTKNFILFHGF